MAPKIIELSAEEQARIINLQQERQTRDYYFYWMWSSYHDDFDIFDLRYLFDHEEIREHRRELEDEEMFAENPQYYRFMLYDNNEMDYEEEEEDEEERMRRENYVPPPPENWDDDNYNIRFDMRLGFHTKYDSGIEMSEEEEEDEDEEFIRRFMRGPDW